MTDTTERPKALRNTGASGPPKSDRLETDQVSYSRWCLHR